MYKRFVTRPNRSHKSRQYRVFPSFPSRHKVVFIIYVDEETSLSLTSDIQMTEIISWLLRYIGRVIEILIMLYLLLVQVSSKSKIHYLAADLDTWMVPTPCMYGVLWYLSIRAYIPQTPMPTVSSIYLAHEIKWECNYCNTYICI